MDPVLMGRSKPLSFVRVARVPRQVKKPVPDKNTFFSSTTFNECQPEEKRLDYSK
jgi:hypothetical protein